VSEVDKLPVGWVEIVFDEAIEVISDRGIRIQQKAYLPEGALPVVDQGDGLIGGYTNDLAAQVVAPAPVIVFGDHTRRFKFVKFPFAVGADGVKLFAPTDLWFPEFLYLQLGTVDLENRGYGRHYQQLRKKSLALPPRAEQARIVAKLEELLTDLDAGVAELKAAQKKLKQYRQSLLKSAVEGALTAEWRAQHTPSETGAQLLQRILTERRARWEAKQLAKFKNQGKTPPKDWQKKYPEPVQPDTTDLPKLPESWAWASLDILGEIASGVAKGTKRTADVEVREVPYLRVANVQRGFLNLSEIKTILATERDIAELTLQAGDILFNEGGDRDKLGRGWVWRDEVANCIHQNHVFRMRPYLREVLPELISHHGNTFGKTWFQNAGKQTTNLASINMTMLRMFPVPLGPADEQRELLTLLELQIEQIDRQEQAVELGLKQANAQRQNILRAAFAGRLVPQDPNDEPASVLLERIRAERAERDKQPKVRKVRKTKQQMEVAAVVSKLIDVLAEAGDWVSAQEAFCHCGVVDGALTDQIEALYAELRALDQAGRLAVEAVTDEQGRKLHDRLKLLAG